MEKINVAELLRNCPEGMELDCTMHEDVYFDYVDRINIIHCYIQYETYRTSITLSQHGAINNDMKSKCIIFPKGKTTWEGFQRPFKDGDIIFTHANCLKVGLGNTWISIFQEKRNGGVATYVDYAENGSDLYADEDKGLLCMNEDIMRQRLATEEEKEKLFQAIKVNGYKWNEENKALEKLPKFKVGDRIQDIDAYKVKITEINIDDECYGYESIIAKGIGSIPFNEQNNWKLVSDKFDITTLVPFESRVLVRDNDKEKWHPAFWGFHDVNSGYPYKLIGCIARYCIPYEGNEHLLGTTDDCDEFYKNWE